MNIYRALLLKDLRHAARDPVLLALVIGPLALLLLARFGFPVAANWLSAHMSFSLHEYRHFTAALFATTIPMLAGMMTGLMMLDERDEHVVAYYAVTPLRRGGYLRYRLLLPSLLSFILLALFLWLSDLAGWRIDSVLALLLLALEAPGFALFLAACSANKVEGLALSKLGGLFIAGPLVAEFAPGGWQLLAAPLPTYWPARLLLADDGVATLHAYWPFIIGLTLHIALLVWLRRTFLIRSD